MITHRRWVASAAARGPEKLQASGPWRRIEEEFLATGDAAAVLSGLTGATDAIAREAWLGAIEPVFPHSAAMLAVGAYGRRETYPYSGADILVLLDRNPDAPAMKSALAEFARLLADAGLRLNYSALTIAQCLDAGEQDPESTANLLDRRFLAGDGGLHERLEGRLPPALTKRSHDIRARLVQAARVRHARFQNTCHHLQPDVKDAPGGLRDLRLIDRLARLDTEIEPSGDRLAEAGALLAAARCFLHYRCGSDSNLLDFEAQEALLERPFAGMRRYFRNAREIWNETRRALDLSERNHGSLLESLRERARPASAEFTVSRERVLLRNPSRLETDPGLVFGLLEFIARHGVPPAPETERRLEAVGPAFAALCARPGPLWPKVKSILACPHVAAALRALESTGLLTALFPEWAGIEDLPLPQADRRYTVDEHTLAAIERLADLRAARDPARRRFADLLSEIEDPAPLLFALFFHCLGPADAAMARIEMPSADRDAAAFLFDHQRDLADTVSGRDLDDPDTARLLAERVGTVERLKLLTVFTYAADPGEMTPWRVEQLWRALSVTQHELTRELRTDRIGQAPLGISGPAEFLQGFPMRYLRARAQAEIEAHLRLYELSRPTGAAVQIDPTEGAYNLTIVARDRPYLFASFAGAITSFGLDILKAEAFANNRGVILDTFVFSDPKRRLQSNPAEAERLGDLIQRVALGKTDARGLMRNPPLPDPRKGTGSARVHFDSEACETATLVEIVAEDRPGLLYSLAAVFASNACNIDVVLIDTKGRRAIDVFYVAHEGRKLPPEVQERLREKLLAAC